LVKFFELLLKLLRTSISLSDESTFGLMRMQLSVNMRLLSFVNFAFWIGTRFPTLMLLKGFYCNGGKIADLDFAMVYCGVGAADSDYCLKDEALSPRLLRTTRV
jgi:hypothetical protein